MARMVNKSFFLNFYIILVLLLIFAFDQTGFAEEISKEALINGVLLIVLGLLALGISYPLTLFSFSLLQSFVIGISVILFWLFILEGLHLRPDLDNLPRHVLGDKIEKPKINSSKVIPMNFS